VLGAQVTTRQPSAGPHRHARRRGRPAWLRRMALLLVHGVPRPDRDPWARHRRGGRLFDDRARAAARGRPHRRAARHRLVPRTMLSLAPGGTTASRAGVTPRSLTFTYFVSWDGVISISAEWMNTRLLMVHAVPAPGARLHRYTGRFGPAELRYLPTMTVRNVLACHRTGRGLPRARLLPRPPGAARRTRHAGRPRPHRRRSGRLTRRGEDEGQQGGGIIVTRTVAEPMSVPSGANASSVSVCRTEVHCPA
jgi:hypothetical protein